MDRKEQAKALRCILESRLERSQTKISFARHYCPGAGGAAAQPGRGGKSMKEPIIIDAEYTIIPPGRSREEVRRKRRRQRLEADVKFLTMQGTLVAAVAVVTALLLR